MARDNRDVIQLECTQCKYRIETTKNVKNTPDRIELRKFCKKCGVYRIHKETK